ncbi:amidohydrolase family protein [Rhodococcus sp. BP-149]|uniref:amidohydrolase family protein n=1 Tax=unclassified Rhodococcus (in: high G+C Gram-positive bacteria) TaxID=192944 RepID=UPI001C9A82B9|nr:MULTISPECIES: amidohydrolase family protein [unclassified Rhodococcus (in: high G+C Gram-positive bacteria)]MBY6685671.1 amidohydrolase family protein [Rhodococcus sp. BP-288]MBY6694781.1 amidohydrolase family protein [Rhodococcus sp. BP-188]MBY6696627.1 amidohydrolase family protein [Rhodococcus sp. BP-285]MBY6703283.1 amidohydrolase family protein [Rhodococcus sp. BP-283]MBY6708606.1 amidohydrolase family protein [Rhodococcus sp. BP-241]
MDSADTVLRDADVLVVDGRIAAVGHGVTAPDDAHVIDASGGIVMPGMIDTHRHMWQSVMRGYGADWTLAQYAVWYFFNHGIKFRPEDIAAGNAVSALDALESGVTTSVDWSHGLQTLDHAEAARDALVSSPGRFFLAYGNAWAPPAQWTADPAIRSFLAECRDDSALYGTLLAFDVMNKDAEFPEIAAFHAARDLGLSVTTHAGVWGGIGDQSIDNMYAAGVMQPGHTYVHAASLSDSSYQKIAGTGGNVSLSTESESTCGQGYPPVHHLRRHGIDASLSIDSSVWFSSDMFSAMRSTIDAARAYEHLVAHQSGASVTNIGLRVKDAVALATRDGAKALGKFHEIGSLEVGKLADVVLVKNDRSPTFSTILNPYGHLVYQACRGDVHTVLVGGRVVKSEGALADADLDGVKTRIGDTVEYLQRELGDEWEAGMNPELPDTEVLANPYQFQRDAETAGSPS